MAASEVKIAINPLPWIIGADSSWNMNESVIRGALADLRTVGFTALHADIPAGISVADYRVMLTEFGFEPAPGYFGADFELVHERPAVLEAARRAAGEQAELGLSEIFIASNLSAERRASPAIGAAFDPGRLATVTDGLIAAAAVMKAEGVSAGLHPHVGSWVEVEDEVRAVLDNSAGSDLSFGPDTGHLFWAGADPAGLIADYQDRVIAVHIKDIDGAARERAVRSRSDYGVSTIGQHVFTEPGRGSIDFGAVFEALPARFAGWFVVEVDVPNIPDKVESAKASFAWVTARPELLGARV
jgi:inosose dehydratase